MPEFAALRQFAALPVAHASPPVSSRNQFASRLKAVSAVCFERISPRVEGGQRPRTESNPGQK